MITDEEKLSEAHLRWWIIDGVAHRETEYREPIPESIEVDGVEIPVIAAPRPDPDEWICDFCNATIPVTNDEGTRQFIPMFASNALCPSCMADCLTTDERARITERFNPAIWSENACACEGCVTALGIEISMARHPSNNPFTS